MSEQWLKEKAYTAKRAEQLRQIMNDAIDNGDWDTFQEAYTKSLRYMPKKQSNPIYRRFLEKRCAERDYRRCLV